MADAVRDIEDVVSDSARANWCPFAAARAMAGHVQLVLAPYHYIVDLRTLMAHGVDPSTSIVVCDEAHNLPSVAREAASGCVTIAELQGCIKAVSGCCCRCAGVCNVRPRACVRPYACV